MSLADELAKISAKLDADIGTVMTTIVADQAKWTLQRAVETEVYEKYDPLVYRRKGDEGGLADKDLMEARYDPAEMLLEVQSIREDGGRLIAPIVESGKGYTFESKGAAYMKPRPFHSVAEEMLGEGPFEKALAGGLYKLGYTDIKF